MRNEDDYDRMRERANELHAGAAVSPLIELELERIAVAMLEWELKRGNTDG